jgi:hypothetical protein
LNRPTIGLFKPPILMPHCSKLEPKTTLETSVELKNLHSKRVENMYFDVFQGCYFQCVYLTDLVSWSSCSEEPCAGSLHQLKLTVVLDFYEAIETYSRIGLLRTFVAAVSTPSSPQNAFFATFFRNRASFLNKYTQNECIRCRLTLKTSVEDVKLHSKRVWKMWNYTQNECGRCRLTLKTSVEDVDLHSKRVWRM